MKNIFDIEDDDSQSAPASGQRYDLVIAIAGLEPIEISDVTHDQYVNFLKTNEITDGDGTTYKFIIPSNVAGCIAVSLA